MHAVLALVPLASRETVQTHADRLADDLWRWGLAAGGRFDRRLADRLAVVVAAIAPDLHLSRLVVLSRYSLWTVLLDDRLDEPGVDPAVLRGLTERLSAVAHGDAPGAAESDGPGATRERVLAATLAQLLVAFRAYGRDELLLARFTEALCDAMRAAVEQAERSLQVDLGRAAPPFAAEYLALASRHINYRSFAYGLTLLVSQGRAGEFIEQIDAALVPACRAVRLANDMRTVKRDITAGRLNVLVLRHKDGTAVQAAAVVRQIDNDVRLHYRLLRKIQGSAVRPCVAALENSLRMAVGAYRVADLR